MSDRSYPMTDDLFKVRVFDTDGGRLTDALAIVDERAHEIEQVCMAAYMSSDTIAEAYEKAISKVKHINEACYAITIIAVNHASNKNSNPLEKLLKALRDMKDSQDGE